MARAVIINVSGVDTVNGVADETLVAGPWDPATIGIAGGVNLDFMPSVYSEDFTPGGSTGFFMGHWPDGLGGQFSAIKVNVGFIGDFNIQSPYLYSLVSGTPTVSPNDGFVLSAVANQAGMIVYEDTAKRVEVGYLSAGVFGLKAYDTGGSTAVFEVSDTQQMIGGVLFDNGALFSSNFFAGQQGYQISATGSAEFENITARGEFHASVLVQDEIHALGGQFMPNTAAVLLGDITTVTSPTTFTMDLKDPPSGHTQVFFANDLVRIKDGSGKDNYIRIDSASDQTTFYRYTCTKQNGTNGTFYAGTAVVYWGTTTAGSLLNIVGVGADAPYIDVFSHTGTPWSSTVPNLRIGNLDGVTDGDFSNLGGYGLYADNIFLKGAYQSTAGAGKRITINEDEGSGANNAMLFYDSTGLVVRIDDSLDSYYGTGAGILVLDPSNPSTDFATITAGVFYSVVRSLKDSSQFKNFYSGVNSSTALDLATQTEVADTGGNRRGLNISTRVLHASSTVDALGLLSFTENKGSGIKYGIFSDVRGTGSGVEYAIYATATGSGTSYAGYFAAGDVYVADNLVVGTLTPDADNKLTIEDGVAGGRTFMNLNNTNTNQFLKMGINGNFAEIGCDDGDTIRFGTFATTATTTLTTLMSILPSGFVGIGTVGPDIHLSLDGGLGFLNANNQFTAYIASKGNPKIYQTTSGGSYPFNNNGHLVLQPRTAGLFDIIFATGNTTPSPRLVINGSGAVIVGGTVAATSALLDLQSTTGALLVPRMTTTQKNALTAVNSMIIYDSTLNQFAFRENGAWVSGSGLA